jgi:3-hydroxyisobutyrate dehydrogenase-like beta-hydroxyacid dehydrogenase
MNIGFIGLGNMGRGIAGNLLKAGHQLTVWNRSREKGKAFVSSGARMAESPADAARGAEAVITMLTDDLALEQVVFGDDGLLNTLSREGIHISMSTISVALSQRLQKTHGERGQEYVSAPVFGRPEAAAAAKLFVVPAGPKKAIEKCQPLFSAIGQQTFVMGEEAPMANVVKLSGNFLIASVIESMGEAMALVRKYGVDAQQYLELLTNTLFAAPVYKTYGGLIVNQQFEPAGFQLKLGLKDVRLALAAGEALSVPLPVASLIRDQALAAIASGLGEKDWSSLSQMAARNAGLK